MNGIDQSISPGIGGFITFFLLACALWLLMRNMVGHLRKVDRREELAEEERRRGGAGDADDEAVSSRPSSAAADVPRHGRSESAAVGALPHVDGEKSSHDA